MGFFSSKPKQTDVELLQERSRNVLGVFTKTMEDLKTVNAEIETAKTEKNQLINQLTIETQALETTMAKNSLVIDKIQKILE